MPSASPGKSSSNSSTSPLSGTSTPKATPSSLPSTGPSSFPGSKIAQSVSLHLIPPTDKPASSSEEHTPIEGPAKQKPFTSLLAFTNKKDDTNLSTSIATLTPAQSTLADGTKVEPEHQELNLSLTHSWWGDHDKSLVRAPKRQASLPNEQTLAYERAKAAVIRATTATLQATQVIAKDILTVGADALEFVPIPGLDVAARLVLSIWQAAEQVETNKLSCLRLTERCANIVYSIRLEVALAGGPDIAESLGEPVAKLTEVFRQINHFIHKQVSRPFIKRYLKRDEDARKIEIADQSLNDAMSLFGIAVQVRMFKAIQELTKQYGGGPLTGNTQLSDEFRTVLDALSNSPPAITSPLPSTSIYRPAPEHLPTTSLGPLTLPPTLSKQAVLTALTSLRAAQAARDSVLDTVELYAAMRAALRSGDDMEMLQVLQIGRSDVQEGIKILQRALEDPRLRVGGAGALGGTVPVISSGATATTTVSSAIAQTGPPVMAVTVPNRHKTLPTLPERRVSSSSLTSEHGHEVHLSESPSASDSASTAYWTLPSSQHSVHVSTPFDDPSQECAFHREFLESGLEALRRLSDPLSSSSDDWGPEGLPPWTITRWEVDRESKIGVGYFSDVYKGLWGGHTVAIKILSPTAPRRLFQHETRIWASLRHPNVLELFGASSATGDPPWFFVSPYMKNGSLVSFLRAKAARQKGKEKIVRGRQLKRKTYPGPLQMMHEIAVGMAYLHRKGVLHGDLKGNNVLIDDDLHCVISDFGQSELRSEVYRLSQKPKPHGATRWQAPEIMSGEGVLSEPADVYAFAIVCVEILTRGELPWPMLDDQSVQLLVLRHNKRPKIPLRPETTLTLVGLIEQSWSTDPYSRPLFEELAKGLGHLMGGFRGGKLSPSPHPSARNSESESGSWRLNELMREKGYQKSPDMKPVDLPGDSSAGSLGQDAWEDISQETAVKNPTAPIGKQLIIPPQAVTGLPPRVDMQDSHIHEHAQSHRSEGTDSPVSLWSSASNSDVDRYSLWGGYGSPMPRDQQVAMRRDERRYRLLLEHDFHPTLNLPLWEPTPVHIGAVGYLSKPAGRFITFFNALNPHGATEPRLQGVRSIYNYGSVTLQSAPTQSKKNLREIMSDLFPFTKGNMTPPVPDGTFAHPVKKRYPYQLRAGHKHAYLCTEGTVYRYMENIDAAKAWFKANVKVVLECFGKTHNLHREDVYLVIGTLETRDYGLLVSHEHPDGQAYFNVYADRKDGEDWGIFSTEATPTTIPGPAYDGDGSTLSEVNANKTSRVRPVVDGEVDAVLLARLRFRPDDDEPTRV